MWFAWLIFNDMLFSVLVQLHVYIRMVYTFHAADGLSAPPKRWILHVREWDTDNGYNGTWRLNAMSQRINIRSVVASRISHRRACYFFFHVSFFSNTFSWCVCLCSVLTVHVTAPYSLSCVHHIRHCSLFGLSFFPVIKFRSMCVCVCVCILRFKFNNRPFLKNLTQYVVSVKTLTRPCSFAHSLCLSSH